MRRSAGDSGARRSAPSPPLSDQSGTTGQGSPIPPSPSRSPGDTRSRQDSPTPLRGEVSNVRVMVRIRPFSEQEIEKAQASGGHVRSVVEAVRSDQVELLDERKDYEVKQAFAFDQVFWSVKVQKSALEYASQAHVYEETGVVALDAAWGGMNSCIFAYGQTGSGKTHTMMGNPAKIQDGELDDEDMGVIPRLCRQLFQEIAERKKHSLRTGIQKMFKVQVQFIEIYNEKVRDLLSGSNVCKSYTRSVLGNQPREPKKPGWFADQARDSGAAADFTQGTHPLRDPLDIGRKQDDFDLKIREHPTEGPVLEGCTVHEPQTYEEMFRLITEGNRDRSTAATKMNDRSSRSHALFRVALHQVSSFEMERVGIGGPLQHSSERRANINLVDLAGSENVKRSGASGATMVEAQKINQSLTTLRRVIDALLDRKQYSVVPYRDSTLTWLLRTDLGGSSRCVMLATVSPHYLNAYETQRTLTYAMRARSIVNTVKVNEDDTAQMLADLERRMREAQLAMQCDGISAEERSKLEQDVAAAQTAHEELEQRIAEMQKQAEAFQKELDATRRAVAAHTLKNCLVMHMARQRQKRSMEQHARSSEEMEQVKQKLAALGHEDVQSLAESLKGTHTRVAELDEERQRLAAAAEATQEAVRARAEELAAQQRQLAGQEQEKADAALSEVDSIRKELSEMQLHTKSLAERHATDMAEIADEHERVTGALVYEMEAKAKEFAQEKERWVREMEELEDRCETRTRQAEDRAQGRIRVLQDNEASLKRQLQRTRGDLSQKSAVLESIEQDLQSQRMDFRAELERRLKEHEGKVAAEIARVQLEHAALLKSLAKVEKISQQRDSHRQMMQSFFERMEARGSVYKGHHDKVSGFIGFLRSEEIPEKWTLANVGTMFAALAQFRDEYSAHRPNMDTVKQVLREYSERRGTAGPDALPQPPPAIEPATLTDAAAGSLCNGLIDGQLPLGGMAHGYGPRSSRARSRSRSPAGVKRGSSAHSDSGSCYSEADKLPYVSEPWQEEEDLLAPAVAPQLDRAAWAGGRRSGGRQATRSPARASTGSPRRGGARAAARPRR